MIMMIMMSMMTMISMMTDHDEHDGHGDGHDKEVWQSQASLPKNMPKKRQIKNVYVKGSRDLQMVFLARSGLKTD